MHFDLLVKVSAERLVAHGGDVENAVAAMLGPLCSNRPIKSAGDSSKLCLKFLVLEPTYRERWESGVELRVRMPDGRLLTPWDGAFRVPGTTGIQLSHYRIPEHLKPVDVPLRELFPTFEAFMASEHPDIERDPETGRYGVWLNPNSRCHFYIVGGRWSWRLRVREGAKSAGRGSPAHQQFLVQMTWDCPEERDSDCMRRLAHETDIHLQELRQLIEPDGIRTFQLDEPPEPNVADFAQFADLDMEATAKAEAEKQSYCHNRIFSTTAVLDEEGWHEKDVTTDKGEWEAGFKNRFLDGTPPDTTMVIVDCAR